MGCEGAYHVAEIAKLRTCNLLAGGSRRQHVATVNRSDNVNYYWYIIQAIIQHISPSPPLLPDKFTMCWSLTLSEPELKLNDPETIGDFVQRNSGLARHVMTRSGQMDCRCELRKQL